MLSEAGLSILAYLMLMLNWCVIFLVVQKVSLILCCFLLCLFVFTCDTEQIQLLLLEEAVYQEEPTVFFFTWRFFEC